MTTHANELRELRSKRIKLGLDLQGGMRVVLEVNVLKLIEDLAKNKDDNYAQIIKAVQEEVQAFGGISRASPSPTV